MPFAAGASEREEPRDDTEQRVGVPVAGCRQNRDEQVRRDHPPEPVQPAERPTHEEQRDARERREPEEDQQRVRVRRPEVSVVHEVLSRCIARTARHSRARYAHEAQHLRAYESFFISNAAFSPRVSATIEPRSRRNVRFS